MPESTAVAVGEVYQSLGIPTPGAYRSTHDPVFENEACASEASVAATVTAAGTRAGDAEQASAEELPAATTTVTPSLMREFTAESTVELAPPPRLMFATAGCPAAWSPATQSSPAMTPDHVPDP